MGGKDKAKAAESRRKRRDARKSKDAKKAMPDYQKVLFESIVDKSEHSKEYNDVTMKGYIPAVQMLEKCFKKFHDKDGNFVQQFQTTGFSARLWELYLNTYFVSTGFQVDASVAFPDFCLSKNSNHFCVEAVTTNKSQSGALANIKLGDNYEEKRKFHIIKMANSLWSKVQKKYWEKDHVKDKPLVFAIECFHDDDSQSWSDSPLIDYLYGKSFSWYYDKNNQLVIQNSDETSVDVGGRKVPSGLFNRDDTKNVSAVIFSNSATISKFLRMGKQKWPKFPHIVTRMGTCYKHDNNETKPNRFEYYVGEHDSPIESWGSGLTVFHNPNASHPLDSTLLADLPHGFFKDGNFVMENVPSFQPITSKTLVLT
jgi:hypothetical protein